MSWTVDISDPPTASDEDRLGDAASDRQALGGLAEMSEFYRQLGFDAGYGQAARDQLELSVAIAEQILQECGDSLRGATDARKLLYSFIARVDRRLGLVGPSSAPHSDVKLGNVKQESWKEVLESK